MEGWDQYNECSTHVFAYFSISNSILSTTLTRSSIHARIGSLLQVRCCQRFMNVTINGPGTIFVHDEISDVPTLNVMWLRRQRKLPRNKRTS